MDNLDKIIFNQKYIISFTPTFIDIYDNNNNIIILNFYFKEGITDIQFHPILNNIILISSLKGYCKICEIVEKKIQEKIVFEGLSDEFLLLSKFNCLDSNIIATLNNTQTIIIIWDVRDIKYVNVLKNEEEKILNYKWNKLFKDLLEIKTKNKIKLINIRSGKVIRYLENNNNQIKNVLFLKNDNIIIKNNIIEKSNIENNILNYLEFVDIRDSNDNFIKDNILIIFLFAELIFIDIEKMEKINSINFEFNIRYKFYNSDKDKEILLYYFRDGILKNEPIELNSKISNINDYSDLSNIKKNFYNIYQRKICKYISLLNFKENIIEENINDKKYMEIEEIMEFFNKIKRIDIFYRKDFVNYIFGGKKISNEKYNDILNINDFTEIMQYSKLFDIKKTEQRKNEMINKIKENINDNNDKINKFYIQIIKLIILDNSNEKLVEIYLIFLFIYKDYLIKNFAEQIIEGYDSEVKYYYPCFSKSEYKILFGLDKESEKDIVINFLNTAYNIKSYVFSSTDLKDLVEKAKILLKNIPDFNQPIELDNQNEELKWHKIKINILSAFGGFELTNDEQDALGRLKTGIHTIVDKKLLENESIVTDKDKLECSLILIINPCDVSTKDFEFCSNLLLSGKINEEKLSKLKKNYKDAQYLCLENISEKFKQYEENEKYNFKYLVDNYVVNQNEIKSFLKNILIKNVFKEAYKILFGNDEYKLLNERYLEEFVDKRLKFAPIRPFGSAALSDKMSLNTYIAAKKRLIQDVESDEIRLILNTGCYVSIEEHEIFHLLDCLPYYENNCSISIKTPRKKNYNYNGKAEGGIYLEYLLFNREIKQLNLREILYILNEKNYEKSLIDFREGFEKLELKDLKIEGTFSKYNNYIDFKYIEQYKLLNPLINVKSSMTDISYSIKYELKNDVIGNRPFFK